jgi:DNA-binding transcriptional LysR family regulator
MDGLRLSLDALQVLDAIDRRGSFAAAGEELFRTASTLSYVIQKLESELNVTVFDRSGHRARLTPAGRTLLDDGRVLLHAARRLEHRVRRVESGWEAELRIVVDAIVAFAPVVPTIDAFAALGSPTRLRLLSEVLGGSWEALAADRADLVIGAAGPVPSLPGCSHRVLGDLPVAFVVAPVHPLADQGEPLTRELLRAQRAIAIGDSSHHQPPRSLGLLDGQDTLVVPTVDAKLLLLLAGLGVGYLPRHVVAPHIERGALIEKPVVEGRASDTLHLAWREGELGEAGRWWIDRLSTFAFARAIGLRAD